MPVGSKKKKSKLHIYRDRLFHVGLSPGCGIGRRSVGTKTSTSEATKTAKACEYERPDRNGVKNYTQVEFSTESLVNTSM